MIILLVIVSCTPAVNPQARSTGRLGPAGRLVQRTEVGRATTVGNDAEELSFERLDTVLQIGLEKPS